MRFEFHTSEVPDVVVARAIWREGRVDVECDDYNVRQSLIHAFRPTPVVVDDGAYRRLGASGDVVLQPGDLEWFRAAAQVRATAETGLVARLSSQLAGGGYDPAASYRTFEESIERLGSG